MRRPQAIQTAISVLLAGFVVWLSVRPTGLILLVALGFVVLVLSLVPMSLNLFDYRIGKGSSTIVVI